MQPSETTRRVARPEAPRQVEEHDVSFANELRGSEPASFRERIRDVTEAQLAKAGYRLAALLERVWP
jgi:hypothetical protein